MNTKDKWGGSWTEAKLNILRKYIKPYMDIMKGNIGAQYYRTSYIDGFSGTGNVNIRDKEGYQFGKGSVRIALDNDKKFDRYCFIELDKDKSVELKKMLENNYPELLKTAEIEVIPGDSNAHIQKICRETNWGRERALIFLDPYGIQVKISTLKEIAKTEAIDLWLLVSIQAIVRMLPKERLPYQSTSRTLDDLFGTHDWEKELYKKDEQLNLFDEEKKRRVAISEIREFITGELRKIFKYVPEPGILRNSKNSELFYFYFTSSNKVGKKIAEYLLEKI